MPLRVKWSLGSTPLTSRYVRPTSTNRTRVATLVSPAMDAMRLERPDLVLGER